MSLFVLIKFFSRDGVLVKIYINLKNYENIIICYKEQIAMSSFKIFTDIHLQSKK